MNEQDKQQILNGAYGITRSGNKAKLLYTSPINDDSCKHLFIIKNKAEDESIWLDSNLNFYSKARSDNDIVGLWKESVKPFDLQKALQGEPVVLRNGEKALIQYNVLNFVKNGIEFTGELPLKGFRYSKVKEVTKIYTEEWAITGESYPNIKSNTDIIGMWLEPEQSNNALPPKALKEPKKGMWYLDLNSEDVFLSSYSEENPMALDRKTFNLGMYFDSKEKAEAMLHFLKNNKE